MIIDFQSVFIGVHVFGFALIVSMFFQNTLNSITQISGISLFLFSYVIHSMNYSTFLHRFIVHHSFSTSNIWFVRVFTIFAYLSLFGPLKRWKEFHLNQHQINNLNTNSNSANSTTNSDDSTNKIFSFENFLSLFSTNTTNMTKTNKSKEDEQLFDLLETYFFLPWIFVASFLFFNFNLNILFLSLVLPQIVLYHSVFLTERFGSRFGTKRFKCEGRNNGWLCLLNGLSGEGLLNNHFSAQESSSFACPDEKRNRWWEIDLSFSILIRSLVALKIANIDEIEMSESIEKRKKLAMNFDQNKLFEGRVLHSRWHPLKHSFHYDIFFVLLEISDKFVDHAFDDYWFWSSNDVGRSSLFSMASFRKSWYQSPGLIAAQLKKDLSVDVDLENGGKIFLLTHWSYFGVHFNPVSYYYCYDSSQKLVAIVSEVHNTPWNEKIWYYHSAETQKPTTATTTTTTDSNESTLYYALFKKRMHVSPFFGMEYHYRLLCSEPLGTKDGSLRVTWHLVKLPENMAKDELKLNTKLLIGNTDFFAHMTLFPQSISQSSLNRLLLKWPSITISVMIAIYWQALVLLVRGVKFVSHPMYGPTPQVHQPQSSIDSQN